MGHLAYVEESDWIDRTRMILEQGLSGVFEPIDREAGFERFSDIDLSDLLEHFATFETRISTCCIRWSNQRISTIVVSTLISGRSDLSSYWPPGSYTI